MVVFTIIGIVVTAALALIGLSTVVTGLIVSVTQTVHRSGKDIAEEVFDTFE